MEYKVKVVSSVSDIPQGTWDALAKGEGPFLRYDFLNALEQSACCNKASGWISQHILIEKASGAGQAVVNDQPLVNALPLAKEPTPITEEARCAFDESTVIAIIPGYLKTHSYGEYVFDHSWANAYHQHGIPYYPKWVAAIPFTPVTGSRILTREDTPFDEALLNLISHTVQSMGEETVSSCHWLFTNTRTQNLLGNHSDLLTRYAVQFQWHNYQYTSFESFLNALTSRKRRDMKKTQRKLVEQGIRYRHLTGSEITDEVLDFFLQCYQATYLKRSGHTGYLNEAFFRQLRNTMAENMLIVTAYRNDTPIASALFFFDDTGLYGRYWGALEEVSGLHFACCYFEGIAFAIEKGLPLFNPGTQGEHKILRGFEPIYCQSQHQLFSAPFHDAVASFLQQESEHIVAYFNQAQDVLPFNNDITPSLKTTNTPNPLLAVDNHNEKTI